MSEVRVRARFSNAVDEGLVRRGQLADSQVRRVDLDAVVDAGAINCVLPVSVANTLGLARPFQQVAQYADGRQENVDVTEPTLIEILGRKAYEECLVLGDEVRIGQTALEKMDLQVDCRGQTVIPNPAHPNQPVVRVR